MTNAALTPEPVTVEPVTVEPVTHMTGFAEAGDSVWVSETLLVIQSVTPITALSDSFYEVVAVGTDGEVHRWTTWVRPIKAHRIESVEGDYLD